MRILAFIALIWAAFCVPAWGQVLTAASYEENGGETRVWLTFDEPLGTAPEFFLIDGGATRFVADFKQASARIGGTPISNGQRQVEGQGLIDSLRYARRGETGLRIVFDLMSAARLKEHVIADSMVSFTFTNPTASVSTSEPVVEIFEPQPVPEIVSAPVLVNGIREFAGVPHPRIKPQAAAAKRRPIIVIDPGHGGYDPGAVGSLGTLEKGITFKGAQELQKQLVATGRYKVMLTRSSDTYVDHEARLRIARAGGADLFISIHADSAGNSSARGASVYTLSDTSKTRTREVINTQNWIMDVDLNEQSDPVGNILVDLAQRKTASQSEQFADILIPHLQDSTRLVGNSHRRAGYFVLLAPDVPAVLLEMGFLSNADDEVLLKNARHRKKMMKSVTKAINTYFDNQTP